MKWLKELQEVLSTVDKVKREQGVDLIKLINENISKEETDREKQLKKDVEETIQSWELSDILNEGIVPEDIIIPINANAKMTKQVPAYEKDEKIYVDFIIMHEGKRVKFSCRKRGIEANNEIYDIPYGYPIELTRKDFYFTE